MEAKDLLWLLLFTLLVFLSNCLCFLVVKSLKNKALGKQSIYDQVVQDTFLVGTFFCSWVSLIVIVTRFTWCRTLITDSDLLLTLVCSMTVFIRMALFFFTACLCIIPILCIFHMTFFEETIGESQIRKIYFTVTLLVGVFVLFALFTYYKIISGLLLAYNWAQIVKCW